MLVVIAYVGSFSVVVNSHDDHYIGHDYDHDLDRRHVVAMNNDVTMAVANAGLFGKATADLDDCDHSIRAMMCREQVHKQFLARQSVHLPYIYKLVQLLPMSYIRYGRNRNEDVNVHDVLASRCL